MTSPPVLHSLPDVAKKYGLKLRPLLERARRREFTHVHFGRERYMTDDQLKEFLAANTVTQARDEALEAIRARVTRQRSRKAKQGANKATCRPERKAR